MYQVCWKCSRAIEPLNRRERDKKTKKVWNIAYCPYARCAANLDITPAMDIKVWNSAKGYFEDETEAPNDPFA